MRCVQCSDGHRLCSREVPCKTCVGSKRGDECRYPAKAKRITVEPEESEEEAKEDEEGDDNDVDMTTFQKAKNRRQHGNARDLNVSGKSTFLLSILEATGVVSCICLCLGGLCNPRRWRRSLRTSTMFCFHIKSQRVAHEANPVFPKATLHCFDLRGDLNTPPAPRTSSLFSSISKYQQDIPRTAESYG